MEFMIRLVSNESFDHRKSATECQILITGNNLSVPQQKSIIIFLKYLIIFIMNKINKYL